MKAQKTNRNHIEKEASPYNEKVVSIDRVARVVKGGRRFRFRALVVVGDGKGKVGVGIAKGSDVTVAVSKASDVAKRNIQEIVIENNTIPHEVYGKVTSSKILIKPAAAGTGLIAGGVVRIILEAVGIHNALSKSLGSSNKVNTAYATLEALKSLQPRKNWITTAKKPVQKPKTRAEKETVK